MMHDGPHVKASLRDSRSVEPVCMIEILIRDSNGSVYSVPVTPFSHSTPNSTVVPTVLSVLLEHCTILYLAFFHERTRYYRTCYDPISS